MVGTDTLRGTDSQGSTALDSYRHRQGDGKTQGSKAKGSKYGLALG